jgi:hypothetical protein
MLLKSKLTELADAVLQPLTVNTPQASLGFSFLIYKLLILRPSLHNYYENLMSQHVAKVLRMKT